jgi:hypothetical protein
LPFNVKHHARFVELLNKPGQPTKLQVAPFLEDGFSNSEREPAGTSNVFSFQADKELRGILRARNKGGQFNTGSAGFVKTHPSPRGANRLLHSLTAVWLRG